MFPLSGVTDRRNGEAGRTVRHRARHRWQRLSGAVRHRLFGGVRAHRVPLRWIRRAEIAPGDRVCLFVLLPRGGKVLPHSLDHVAAWRAAGYRVVVVAAVGSIDAPVDLSSLDGVEGLAVRLNKGYDFGAWAAMIAGLAASLEKAAVVALANDSVLGPSHRFAAMLERVERADADVLGLIENRQIRRHLQSFVLFFKAGALRADAFRRFWGGVRSGDRTYVIEFYETALLATFAHAGLGVAALFPMADPDGHNPTLTRWRELIEDGFPYLKVQLFRDNPFSVPLDSWRAAAERGGFDVAALDRQIAALKQDGREQWQV